MPNAMAVNGLVCSMRALATMAVAAACCASIAQAETATTDIARLYDKYPLIFMGEWHRNVQQHAFLRDLVRDPAFICRTDDIVVEFGNSRLQNVADDFASGKDLSEAEIRSMYRETVVPFTWNSPVYREFYDTVREVNRQKLCPHLVRILLADPPIDWSKVKTPDDYKPFDDRDGYYADLVDREVLAKHHRALLIAGEPHALRALPPEDADGGLPDPTVAQLIERKHPGALFSIALVTTPAAAGTLKMGPPPSFRIVKGALERADFGIIAPPWTVAPIIVNGKHDWKLGPAKSWPRMGRVVDGLLYLGGDETRLFPPASIYADPVYQQQLRERTTLLKAYSGQDFLPILDDLVKEAAAAPAPANP